MEASSMSEMPIRVFNANPCSAYHRVNAVNAFFTSGQRGCHDEDEAGLECGRIEMYLLMQPYLNIQGS